MFEEILELMLEPMLIRKCTICTVYSTRRKGNLEKLYL